MKRCNMKVYVVSYEDPSSEDFRTLAVFTEEHKQDAEKLASTCWALIVREHELNPSVIFPPVSGFHVAITWFNGTLLYCRSVNEIADDLTLTVPEDIDYFIRKGRHTELWFVASSKEEACERAQRFWTRCHTLITVNGYDLPDCRRNEFLESIRDELDAILKGT